MKVQQKIFRLMNFQKIIQPVTGLNNVWLSFHPTKWNRVGLDSLNTLTTADSARDGYVTKPYKYEINRLCVPIAHSHTNFISVGLVYVWRHDINKSSINCSHLWLANQLNISVTQCMRFLALVLTHIPILNHECNRNYNWFWLQYSTCSTCVCCTCSYYLNYNANTPYKKKVYGKECSCLFRPKLMIKLKM